jgi:hypothetical protein
MKSEKTSYMKKVGDGWKKYKLMFPEHPEGAPRERITWPLKKGEIKLIFEKIGEEPPETRATQKAKAKRERVKREPGAQSERVKTYYDAKRLGYRGRFNVKTQVFRDFINDVLRPSRAAKELLRRHMREEDPTFRIDISEVFLSDVLSRKDLLNDILNIMKNARGWKKKLLKMKVNNKIFIINDTFFIRAAAEVEKFIEDGGDFDGDPNRISYDPEQLASFLDV